MAGYIVRRVLQAIPVLLGTTFLIYFMVFAMPGDPIVALFGEKTPPPQVIEQLRERYHLDQPFIVQYFIFLGNIFRGDLGVSFSGQPVSEILGATFPVTLRLAALAIFFEMVAGITVGLVSGLRKGGIFDASALVVSLILISLPIFVVAFVAQLIFGIQLGWFRTTVGTGAPLQDLILPAIVLATISFAQISRLTRASVIETGGQDFVRTAASKGLSRNRIVPVHILRNSLIPVVTYIGIDIGLLLGGAIVTEAIFNVQGVGQLSFQAIQANDPPVILGVVTILTVVFLVANLIVDILYAALDPRIRYE
jgi:oligopeptide transport system permease protein